MPITDPTSPWASLIRAVLRVAVLIAARFGLKLDEGDLLTLLVAIEAVFQSAQVPARRRQQ